MRSGPTDAVIYCFIAALRHYFVGITVLQDAAYDHITVVFKAKVSATSAALAALFAFGSLPIGHRLRRSRKRKRAGRTTRPTVQHIRDLSIDEESVVVM